MQRACITIVVFILCVVTSASAGSIGGMWRNQLKSVMNITDVDIKKGTFHGYYSSAVGDASGTYPFRGCFFTNEKTEATVISWTVSWQNSERVTTSVTSWVGQLFDDDDSAGAVIKTTWLLVSGTRHEDQWSSTLIGSDEFHRASFTE